MQKDITRRAMTLMTNSHGPVSQRYTMAVFLLGDTNRHRLTHSSTVCHS